MQCPLPPQQANLANQAKLANTQQPLDPLPVQCDRPLAVLPIPA